MNRLNIPVIYLLILGLSLLILDFFYKNQVKNTVYGRNGDILIEEPVKQARSFETENKGNNTIASPRSFSEMGVQSCESIEEEGINTKFGMVIIL
jgi:hypothetical protein